MLCREAEFMIEMQSIVKGHDDPIRKYFCSFFPVEYEPEPTRGIYKRVQGLIGHTRCGLMTITETFSSISKLFKRNAVTRPIPEDVVLEILRRLPPQDILNCRMVCKRWMSLTSTPVFHGLHSTAAHPVILLAPGDQPKVYYIDLAPEEPRIGRFDTTKLQNNHCHVFGGTCNGIVLFWRRVTSTTLLVSICNPLTGRQVTALPVEAHFYLGFWFHPVKREYWFLTVSGGIQMEYKIFNLEGACTVLGWYPASPLAVAINIKCSLYFFIDFPMPPQNCIMIFNTETDKIDFKPHPHSYHCHHSYGGHSRSKWNKDNEDMCLLDVEGSLGFAHSCSTERTLYLWILVDYETWKWIPRYKINLNWDRSMGSLRTLGGVQKGEMLMQYRHCRLFAVNFETRRIRNIDLCIDVHPEKILSACTYVNNLIDPNRVAART